MTDTARCTATLAVHLPDVGPGRIACSLDAGHYDGPTHDEPQRGPEGSWHHARPGHGWADTADGAEPHREPRATTTVRLTTTPAFVLRSAAETTRRRGVGEDVWTRVARGIDELGYRIVGKPEPAAEGSPRARAIEAGGWAEVLEHGRLGANVAEAVVDAIETAGLRIADAAPIPVAEVDDTTPAVSLPDPGDPRIDVVMRSLRYAYGRGVEGAPEPSILNARVLLGRLADVAEALALDTPDHELGALCLVDGCVAHGTPSLASTGAVRPGGSPPDASAGEERPLCVNGARDVGPWTHDDGSTCDEFLSDRASPASGGRWWCTAHQSLLTPAAALADGESLRTVGEPRYEACRALVRLDAGDFPITSWDDLTCGNPVRHQGDDCGGEDRHVDELDLDDIVALRGAPFEVLSMADAIRLPDRSKFVASDQYGMPYGGAPVEVIGGYRTSRLVEGHALVLYRASETPLAIGDVVTEYDLDDLPEDAVIRDNIGRLFERDSDGLWLAPGVRSGDQTLPCLPARLVELPNGAPA